MKQTAFAAALLDPAANLPEDVVARPGIDAARRFAVHRNNVIVSLVDALADSYPVVQALVGDEYFHALGQGFVRQHPPRSPIMAKFGDRFADYIDTFTSAAALPYLSDVARVEWQRVVSWHAADCATLNLDDIAPLLADPSGLAATKWHFHPSVALIESPFAIVSLWSAHQLGTALEVEAELAQVDPFLPETALVLRQSLDVLILNVSASEAAFVRSLRAGASLAQAVEEAESETAGFDLALMMGMLLRSDALAGFSVTTSN